MGDSQQGGNFGWNSKLRTQKLNDRSISRDDNPLDSDGYRSIDSQAPFDQHKQQLKDFFKNLGGSRDYTGKGLDQYMKELDQNMSKDNSIPDDTISQSSKASLMADKLRAKVKNLESSYLQQRSKMPTS